MTDLMSANLHDIANECAEPLYYPTGRLKKTKGLTRADVIQTFNHAFEMIGGVPRLAIWADQNPDDFYKLYGRLLPSSSTTELDGPNEMFIHHVLPPPPRFSPPPPPIPPTVSSTEVITPNAKDNPASVSASVDLPQLPPKAATVEHRSRAPARRKNRSDDK